MLHFSEVSNLGNFFGGGRHFRYSSPAQCVGKSLYRCGRWEESAGSGAPPWPLAEFREATGLTDPPDECRAITWDEPRWAGRIRFVWTDPDGTSHQKEWESPARKEAHKKFAAEVAETLTGFGYSDSCAWGILRAGGPGCAVEATRWTLRWLEGEDFARQPNHDDREAVLVVIWGILRAPFRAPAHRMCAALKALGAPEGYPSSCKKLLNFLRAAEKAALGYFHREAMPQPDEVV